MASFLRYEEKINVTFFEKKCGCLSNMFIVGNRCVIPKNLLSFGTRLQTAVKVYGWVFWDFKFTPILVIQISTQINFHQGFRKILSLVHILSINILDNLILHSNGRLSVLKGISIGSSMFRFWILFTGTPCIFSHPIQTLVGFVCQQIDSVILDWYI